MGRRSLAVTVLVTALALGCAQAEADEETLRDSFATQISTSSFVNDFARDGDELTFTGPDGQGGTAAWLVQIDTVLVEPNDFDDDRPFQGRITSEWWADGEVVEYLGNMTALPTEFLDRGLAQECWAYWVEAERRWDW